MEFSHPYSRYGLALVMEANNLQNPDEVAHNQLQTALIWGLNHFRVKPAEPYEGVDKVKFNFMSYDFIEKNKIFQTRGKTDEGIFLSPNIITTDKQAGKTWNGVSSLIEKLKSNKNSNENLTMSVAAVSSKFNNGKKSQIPPKSSIREVGCAAITNTTPYKPCLTYKKFEKGKWSRKNTTIIPDLTLDKMIKFVALFKMMVRSDTAKDLMQGSVFSETVGKGANAKEVFKPWRPKIFNGNFPNPPRSSALGSIALLGAIGEWSKKANRWSEGEAVLDSLANVPIYMVSYGNAKTFTYNHHVIDLAKEDKLNTIIDSMYFTKLFNAESRSKNKNEYQSFDLFASRFLQLFNRPALKDFLAFRAEYPNPLHILFTTYFTKMEKINEDIVKSAKELGRWLNYVAYLAAKAENSNTKSEEFKKAKAKVLLEIESSAFSAKSGDALIAQVVTRGGRLSQMDAPPEATLFIEKTCSSELPLDNAKNLLMAFSRLRSKYEKPATPPNEDSDELDGTSEDSSEYSEG